ncbi:DNA alkylation repair protein [Rhizobium leguminosarum]
MNPGEAQKYLDLLTKLLLPYGEPWRAKSAQADKATKFECLAIRVPILKRVATQEFDLSQLSQRERLTVYDFIWKNAAYYEVMSVPILYFRSLFLKVEIYQFETIKYWVDRIDNWGHCDDLAVTYSYFNHRFQDDVFPFLEMLNKSNKLWSIRVSIVALIHYSGKNAIYLSPDRAFPMIDRHLSNKNKYIANVVGWVLREYSKKHPEETQAYIEKRRDRLSAVAASRMKS